MREGGCRADHVHSLLPPPYSSFSLFSHKKRWLRVKDLRTFVLQRPNGAFRHVQGLEGAWTKPGRRTPPSRRFVVAHQSLDDLGRLRSDLIVRLSSPNTPFGTLTSKIIV